MDQPLLADVELAGAKVLLRPISVADVDAAFALVHQRREVTDWLVWDGPETREELVRYYESWANRQPSGANYHFAVIERASGAFCGAIGLRFEGHAFEGDVGYWLGARHWSAGLGSEAVALVAWLAFEHLAAEALVARVFESNVASERVLAKNGFREDPDVRDQVVKRDELRALRTFRLTEGEWRAGEARALPLIERVRLCE